MKTWTDSDYAILKEMWEGGYRREVIAARLGVTPNSVSGMVHRRRYNRLRSVEERDVLENREASRACAPKSVAVKNDVATYTKAAEIIRRFQPPPAPVIEMKFPSPPQKPRSIETKRWITKSTTPGVEDVVSPNAKEWVYRNSLRECAFPVGTPETRPAHQFCCGNPITPGKSYCPGHLEIMFPAKIQKRSKW